VVGREEALQELRRVVTGCEFEFATVLEVTDGGSDGFLLGVRSGRRLHSHTLVVAADERSLALDHSAGEPLPEDDVQLWAQLVVTWLAEQLDTGVLRWGQRVTLPDGTVAIDPTLEPEPSSPWWVSPVPLERPTPEAQRRLRRLARDRRQDHVVILGDSIGSEPDPAPGGYLRDVGFDVRAGRAAHAEGRLIEWWQLYLDDTGGSPPAGQLVVAWREGSETVAQLEYLESKPSVPRAAVERLVLAGVHAAADAGAEVIEHRLDADHLQLGLPWQPEDGVMRLNAADVP
jgi:hypothetical protein